MIRFQGPSLLTVLRGSHSGVWSCLPLPMPQGRSDEQAGTPALFLKMKMYAKLYLCTQHPALRRFFFSFPKPPWVSKGASDWLGNTDEKGGLKCQRRLHPKVRNQALSH